MSGRDARFRGKVGIRSESETTEWLRRLSGLAWLAGIDLEEMTRVSVVTADGGAPIDRSELDRLRRLALTTIISEYATLEGLLKVAQGASDQARGGGASRRSGR